MLYLSLFFNLLGIVAAAAFVHRKGGWDYLKRKLGTRDRALERFEDAYHRTRVELIRAFPPGPGDLVLLGDSLTDGGPWPLLLPGVPLRNQGIAGDTTGGVLARLDAVGRPGTVAVLVGINDLNQGRSPAAVLADLARILAGLQAPRVIVQALLPIDHAVWGMPVQQAVLETNRGLAALARERGLEWLDLHALFLRDGRLDPDCTHDGLHLNAAGYQRWAEALGLKVRDHAAQEVAVDQEQHVVGGEGQPL
ncbi:MAG: hypothetical protein JWM80_4596 [Cyanobacteria bacterium RYN_339]|nr:hypothetical protein [Cyanobacteria bacterium RYN_339]